MISALLILTGCGGEEGEPYPPNREASMGPAPTVQVEGGDDPDSPIADVQLVRSGDAGPSYPNARIGLSTPEPGTRAQEGETVEVRFTLSGFELRVPTPEGDTRGIARAPEGQHIHLIVNDRAYEAIYDAEEPVLLEDLPAGTHVIRAFPGRDWHESVKTPGALAQRLVVVGEEEAAFPPPEEWGPTLIYSRPQGDYAGADADSVLVDYVVTNVRLSPDGFRVRLTLNDAREFVMSEWAPYLLVGLPEGDHRLRLELLDPDGRPVATPLHPIEREIRIRP